MMTLLPKIIIALAVLIATSSAASLQGVVIVQYPANNLPSSSSAITLRGNAGGLSWSTGVRMVYTAVDTWSLNITFAANMTTSIEMKAMVDDKTWMIGANAQFKLDWSDTSSLMMRLYPHFYTVNGRYTQPQGNLYSKVFDNYRDIIMYLPASYDENPYKTNYTTIVMHDGENLFNASTSFGGVAWLCQDTVDALASGGQMQEVIILGVYNTAKRMEEYTYSVDPTYGGGKGDYYLDFLEETVYPYVSARYRISTQRDKLGMIGSSLGGLISCYAGWTRAHVYSSVGCMSSSFWWNSQDFNNTILTQRPVPSPWKPAFYLDSGDAGPGKDDEVETITVRTHMQSLGFRMQQNLFYYLDHGGQHNEHYWGDRFWIPMTDLYPPAWQTAVPN